MVAFSIVIALPAHYIVSCPQEEQVLTLGRGTCRWEKGSEEKDHQEPQFDFHLYKCILVLSVLLL